MLKKPTFPHLICTLYIGRYVRVVRHLVSFLQPGFLEIKHEIAVRKLFLSFNTFFVLLLLFWSTSCFENTQLYLILLIDILTGDLYTFRQQTYFIFHPVSQTFEPITIAEYVQQPVAEEGSFVILLENWDCLS